MSIDEIKMEAEGTDEGTTPETAPEEEKGAEGEENA